MADEGVPTVKQAFEMGCCDGITRLHPNSMLISTESLGPTRWTHTYLGTCPFCEERYPLMCLITAGDD